MRGVREEKSIAAHAYVPAFLTIKAKQIQSWSDDIDARHMLPVLLRKLVHSTGQDLLQVDFPGYDNAQRAGWDGLIEAGAAAAVDSRRKILLGVWCQSQSVPQGRERLYSPHPLRVPG